MNEEEMQRRMDFIVEHQVQFCADIERLKELNAQAITRMDKADERLTRLENVVVRFANVTESRFATLTDKVEDLTDKVTKLAESQQRLAESQQRLSDSQAHTDHRLDALIDIIRREREDRSEG